MIPFTLPQLNISLCEYMDIVEKKNEISSCIGYIIGLGDLFFEEGTVEIDEKIAPMLTDDGSTINSRMIPSYAILLWFAIKVTRITRYI